MNTVQGMKSRKNYVPKVKVQTLILMTDGTELEGSVFISATERVLDLMNAPGLFFPLMCNRTGEITLVNKTAINNIKPLE
jgi:hypothetical protein